jgi:hypothetical protein
MYAGLSGKQLTPFNLGVSLMILASVPLLRWRRVPDRIAFTAPAAILLIWWLLPFSTFDILLPEMSADFNVFISSGLILVTAATWIVMYNSDQLLGPVMRALGEFAVSRQHSRRRSVTHSRTDSVRV